MRVLEEISKNEKDHIFDIQISDYKDDGVKYLVLASATKDPFKENNYRSISVGLLINKQLQRKLNFLEDPNIPSVKVGVTCERCAIKNCEVRQSPPIILEKEERNKKIEKIVEKLSDTD